MSESDWSCGLARRLVTRQADSYGPLFVASSLEPYNLVLWNSRVPPPEFGTLLLRLVSGSF